MDNLASHKSPLTRALTEGAGAELRFLPPYSPIENAFLQIKAHLKKAGERTIVALWNRIGQVIDLVTPQHAGNYFAACGYDPT